MSEKKTDDCMREALLMAAAQRFAETPDWQGENSPKYQRRFKRMLADPFEYVKRRQEKPGQKLRRYAAAAVVLLAFAGSSFFCIPQLRVIATNLFTEWYDGYNRYRFAYQLPQSEKIVLPEIEIAYIPEGYEFKEYFINEKGNHAVWEYVNADGEFLSVYLDINDESLNVLIDNEHHKQQYNLLNNGRQAILLIGDDASRRNSVLWTECDGEIALNVSGKFSATELMKIANNINVK